MDNYGYQTTCCECNTRHMLRLSEIATSKIQSRGAPKQGMRSAVSPLAIESKFGPQCPNRVAQRNSVRTDPGAQVRPKHPPCTKRRFAVRIVAWHGALGQIAVSCTGGP